MESLLTNFTTPIVLAFLLGILSKLVKSDLEIPESIYKAISIYLLLAIGLKGGVELSTTAFSEFIWPVTATVFLGILTPIIAYVVLRYIGKLDITNSAGIAAHYGSVSAVTFIAAISYAETIGDPPEGFMPALVALLEVPGIIVALMIPQLFQKNTSSLKGALREVVTGSSIILLLGGLVIGYLAGPVSFEPVKPFFVNGFQGALVIFLLELGMITARRLGDLKEVGFFLLGFGIVVPIIHGVLAIVIGLWAGLSISGASVFAAMVSSGSYIAAPAAVRIALPKASPTLYLTASLGITFPFNIALGIPLYYLIATWFGG